MSGKTLVRVAAILLIGLTVTVTGLEFLRPDRTARSVDTPLAQPVTDPLRAELRRCQQLGEAAARDENCLHVWAQSRDRFLGRSILGPASSGAR